MLPLLRGRAAASALAVALALQAFAAVAPARAAAATSHTDASLDRAMLSYTFARASNEFYKETGGQVLLDGAVGGMRLAVKEHGGNPSLVPSLRDGGSSDADTAKLGRELDLATRTFAKKVGERELAYAAIKGMLQALRDRWTVFLDPKEYKNFNTALDGANYAGVGIVIQIDPATKRIGVQQTMDGGPAAKAGLTAGDVMISINGHDTTGLTILQASTLLRGKVGTPVTLVVQRPGAPATISVSLKRDFVRTPSVLARMLPGNIGYLQVIVFGSSTGQEVDEALTRLDKQGAAGYILDLRNNGGGYLNAAVDVSSKFVPEGPIVSIDSRSKPLTTFDAENTAIAPRPLVVLVNQFTASASEITSGAIQDAGAGTIVGNRTFGKGVVQTVYPLPDGSAIKITTARYLTPSGRDLNAVGIDPDVTVPFVDPQNVGQLETDGQLRRAVEIVRSQLAASPAPIATTSTGAGK
ncbi:MAG TPA: S41 family peptidase [Candidatus Eremiobacteraceae bacterium]|jgi:carboxyl-terminal processing protease